MSAPGIKPRLLATLLGMVNAERNGEVINHGLFRSMTQMLMDLGSAVYQEDFERHFLDASADFYKVPPVRETHVRVRDTVYAREDQRSCVLWERLVLIQLIPGYSVWRYR